jgi:hypothetical protein
VSSLQRETCNQHTTTTKEEKVVNANARVHASWRAYALSKLVTVSCLRFEVAAVKKVLAFCVISVRVAQIRVVQENNDTHVLPMILSDPPHLQYHHCQTWVLIVDDHCPWR